MNWTPPPAWEPDEHPSDLFPEPPLGQLEPWSDDWEMGLMKEHPEYNLFRREQGNGWWDERPTRSDKLKSLREEKHNEGD